MKCRFGMVWKLGAAGDAAAGAWRELGGREVRRTRAKCWLRRVRARESIVGFGEVDLDFKTDMGRWEHNNWGGELGQHKFLSG